eukprot:Nitzschia sp. Nitz4//scaffold144_size56818//34913//37218//NITZ4_006541-RA/size56818-processed-gene-0.69-mRNA-1//1//CDS//3329536528//1896//frame0
MLRSTLLCTYLLLSVTVARSFIPTFLARTSLPWTRHLAPPSVSSAPLSATTDAVSPENWSILSERGRQALQNLIDSDVQGAQAHVYEQWPPKGTQDQDKIKLAEQLADLDASYPGGLSSYLSKARALLKESADGVNPFEEYEAAIPEGESLSFDGEGTMPFSEAEQMGLEHLEGAAFVLVAGGLGERLGYSGIKLSLGTNLCDDMCYLEFYVKYIQAMEAMARKKTGRQDMRIPLVIMTSGDTDPATRQLLKENNNFGMDDDMISIVTQDKVAALKDQSAGLALKDNNRWAIQTKPHGHGDVHHLLLREGLIDQWEKQGRTHVFFLQDTNALVINSIIPTLGVSIAKGFHMNSICIPRLAGEAAGAIARLEHKTDPSKSLVINVEYNQLDPLLRSQGDCKGDVPDPSTGYSPFPGNANNLVLELQAYAKTLRGEDQGVVLEFVNPKYKDETRTDFKKPTRLECMMQDIPKLFQKEMGADCNIGFTMFDRWFTFSPAKNSLEAGVEAVGKGNTAPGTVSSAESDLYVQNQRKLHFAGVDMTVAEEPSDLVNVGGIPVTPGPRILLSPSFGITQKEIKEKVLGGKNIQISQRSSLVLDANHVTIRNLKLDGALEIRAGKDTHITIDGLEVENEGWDLVPNDPSKEYEEAIAIRGYTMNKKQTAVYHVDEPGHFVIGSDGALKPL